MGRWIALRKHMKIRHRRIALVFLALALVEAVIVGYLLLNSTEIEVLTLIQWGLLILSSLMFYFVYSKKKK